MKKTFIFILFWSFIFCSTDGFSQTDTLNKKEPMKNDLQETNSSVRPGTRWWWMGSAVDKQNLTYNLTQYARAGIGSVEITPIYGVQNQQKNEISFLTDQWMEMYKHTLHIADSLHMLVDMNTGTGWPFGGPAITTKLAASKLIVREWIVEGNQIWSALIVPEDIKQKESELLRLMAFGASGVIDLTRKITNNKIEWKIPAGRWHIIAAFNGKTFQQVKRAAPGGEGLVMDHFSAAAVDTYLSYFENAFQRSQAKYPSQFFNDSYEVYGADWTESLFNEFYKRRGYKLEKYLNVFINEEKSEFKSRLLTDYRLTLSELLLDNFTRKWTKWANSHGSLTRNQAHGSPANLIDLYAAVDVPECEGFGLSDFKIPGLRKDSLTRRNDADLSMLKYASSAAHITGKKWVSSETFTWLTEHFRTSLSQCKPDLDLMFVAGVNQLRFHGTTYSPSEAAWPGWLFYASVEMNPSNPIWKDAPAMFDYITRCQTFLQKGKPDNDFLLYLPVYDVWHKESGRLLQFDIHSMEKRMPDFIEAVHQVVKSGYDVDYISDQYVKQLSVVGDEIQTKSGTRYKALILPAVQLIPLEVMRKINVLIQSGAKVIFTHHFPVDIPGFAHYNDNHQKMKKIMQAFPIVDFNKAGHSGFGKGQVIYGNKIAECLQMTGVVPEMMKSEFGLSVIRRKIDGDYLYFVSCLKEKGVDAWIPLAIEAKSVLLTDPLTGQSGMARMRRSQDQLSEIYLQLLPGESVLIHAFSTEKEKSDSWKYADSIISEVEIKGPWTLTFKSSVPQINDTFNLQTTEMWTNLDQSSLKINSGTGVYTSEFFIESDSNRFYELCLDKVRESAVVYVNGKQVQVLWSVPFICDITNYLQKGKNKIQIEVTNLPANRIAQMDRDKINWRIFKEINIVNINYQKADYALWPTMDSGLGGKVTIRSYTLK